MVDKNEAEPTAEARYGPDIVNPRVERGSLALTTRGNIPVQVPQPLLERMHASNAKQVVHKKRVLEAGAKAVPCNAAVPEFLVEYAPNQQTYVATRSARKVRTLQPKYGQVRMQRGSKMIAVGDLTGDDIPASMKELVAL
jgi:hypothetical protein